MSNPKAHTDRAFVLHTTPWSETSQRIEILSPDHGRIGILAKGSRRPRSALRGTLQPFQPLTLSWFGQPGSLRTLKLAEWQGGLPLLQGRALFCGFYLNELLIRLLPREDPHLRLFEVYGQALSAMTRQSASLESTLRIFEWSLLQELGFAPDFAFEGNSRRAIEAAHHYLYVPGGGMIRAEGARRNTVQFHGKTLLDVNGGDYRDPVTLAQSKQLMRLLLSEQLGEQELHSRRILQELPAL